MNNAPRKSEFSKYVEVKLQNATLQAQVQDLARKQMTKKYKDEEPNENSRRTKLRSSNNLEETNISQGLILKLFIIFCYYFMIL